MKNIILGFALVVGTAIAFAQEAPPAPAPGRGEGRAGRGGGRGAPAPPAGPIGRLPDGHPDMQGFWTPPAITDIEPVLGRGGRGGGAARGAGAPGGAAPAGAAPARGGGAESGFGLGGGGNRIIDPPDGKIPY